MTQVVSMIILMKVLDQYSPRLGVHPVDCMTNSNWTVEAE